MITVYGAHKGYYKKEVRLTGTQHTLMLLTISFLIYLEAGAAVFAHVEGWSFLDALYWADFTLLTIGIGNIAPTTHLGRSLLIPYAFGGIIIVGLTVSSIRRSLLERSEARLSARFVEKVRRRKLRKIWKLTKEGPLLHPIGATHGLSQSSADPFEAPEGLTEFERRREEFTLMRKIKTEAARDRRWTYLFVSGSIFASLWLGGAAIFQVNLVYTSIPIYGSALLSCAAHNQHLPFLSTSWILSLTLYDSVLVTR